MRKAKDSDFFVELDGVGKFRFGRRTFGDRMAMGAETSRLTGGNEVDPETSAYASFIAAHKVLCVEAPEGWEDLEQLDLITHSEEKVFELYAKVREVEARFREESNQGSKK